MRLVGTLPGLSMISRRVLSYSLSSLPSCAERKRNSDINVGRMEIIILKADNDCYIKYIE